MGIRSSSPVPSVSQKDANAFVHEFEQNQANFAENTPSDSGDKNERCAMVFVGKTGSGKSTLINSIRGLNPDNPGYAHTSSSMIECTKDRVCYRWDNIDLIDSPGFGTENVPYNKVLDFIKPYQGVVVSAVIFVGCERFTRDEVNALIQLEAKPIMLFFVRNKFDGIVQGHLDSESVELPKEERVSVIRKLENDVKTDMLTVIRPYYKTASKYSSYLLTATLRRFLDDSDSPDGRRLRDELMMVKRLNDGDALDLKQRNYNLIRYKRKVIEGQLWKTLLSIVGKSITSIIPFIDTFVKESIIHGNQNFFFEQFGVEEVLNLVRTDRLYTLNLSDNATVKLRNVAKKIEKEKYLLSIDTIRELLKRKVTIDTNLSETKPEQLDIHDHESENEGFKEMFESPLMKVSLNVIVGSLVTGMGVAAKQLAQQSLKVIVPAATLIATPPFCAYFIYVTYTAVKKMLSRVEVYAYEIHAILHPEDENEIVLIATNDKSTNNI